jgi:hypothetical protein
MFTLISKPFFQCKLLGLHKLLEMKHKPKYNYTYSTYFMTLRLQFLINGNYSVFGNDLRDSLLRKVQNHLECIPTPCPTSTFPGAKSAGRWNLPLTATYSRNYTNINLYYYLKACYLVKYGDWFTITSFQKPVWHSGQQLANHQRPRAEVLL